jgi:hypothetical protein
MKPKKTKTKEPKEEKTQPAEERGERLETGKAIARGGKKTEKVPGASE